ncbi:DUF3732 domain-containing protein [Bacillus altitudinis]|uniref:DUF3732 domain-containing protein n=1 Tax=Bacillus altitudinis TaxID=293387 RepID=UPI00227E1BDE|nr:DUF3732 domain-containing protein [Bacillus altitudinis]MCY7670417.1 DUF3732 domain-containing protein [Bacillus altitudinis]
MNFYIDKIVLWLNNGRIRTLAFKKNAVNVVTGSSGTGKSEILSIIDYCLFGSKPNITDEIINENVTWYGINFHINDKYYTVARASIVNRKVSDKYYFSPVGELPEQPTYKLNEHDLKEILDPEFGISENTIFPIGGKSLKIGSKISLRYFLMFNTLSENIITDTEVFFDKQNTDRYRDALQTVFDLAIGIETEQNLKVKEKLNVLRSELKQLKKRESVIESEINVFHDSLDELITKAKYYNLIDLNITDIDENLNKLIEITEEYRQENIDLNFDKINKLKIEKNLLIQKIRNIKKFSNEYDKYKQLENNTLDSLKPINFIKKSNKIYDFPELKLLVNALSEEYEVIQKEIRKRNPFNFNLSKKLRYYEQELAEITKQIKEVPLNKSTTNEIEKYIFIGSLKAKLEIYKPKKADNNNLEILKNNIRLKEEEIENEFGKQSDYEERKKTMLGLLDELIDTYLIQSEDALGNYKGFKSAFNYKEKKLELRRPKASLPSKVGSSSNFMFLHICLFLGLHELFIRQKSSFVPQWLILDQPSRPYYGEEEIKNDTPWEKVKNTDKGKITIAMKLLNEFIQYVNKELKSDYQFILLEHIPESIWKDEELENFYLVEEFREGNALIRFDDKQEPF